MQVQVALAPWKLMAMIAGLSGEQRVDVHLTE